MSKKWTKPEIRKVEAHERAKFWDAVFVEACTGHPSFNDITVIQYPQQHPQAMGDPETCAAYCQRPCTGV